MSLKELFQQQLLEAACEASATVKVIYHGMLHIVVIVVIAGAELAKAWVDDPVFRVVLWLVEAVIVGRWFVHEVGPLVRGIPGVARFVGRVLTAGLARLSDHLRPISWRRVKR